MIKPKLTHERVLLRQIGMTLIELLIVVVIAGILAAIAYPSYQAYVARAKRSAAEGVLLEAAQFLERNYTTNNCYHRSDGVCATARATNNCAGAAGEVDLTGFCVAPRPPDTAAYNISFQSIVSQSYTLQAVPTGSMAGDSCGTLTLTNTGVKGAAAATGCWSQ
jgi:type IV pilus assembly protein PilE